MRIFPQSICLGLCIFLSIDAYGSHTQKPMRLQDIFITGQASENGAAAQLNISSGSGGTLHRIQLAFYNTYTAASGLTPASCSGLMGVTSDIDNIGGLIISASQTITLSGTSAYSFASELGLTVSDVKCMEIYMDNNTSLSGLNYGDGASATPFDESCSGSSCTTTTIAPSVGWDSSPTPLSDSIPGPVAYVSNFSGNKLTDHSFNSAALSGSTDIISSITSPIGNMATRHYLYVANGSSISINKLNFQSAINRPNSVTLVTDFAPGSGTIKQMALNGAYLYFSQGSNTTNPVWKCTIDYSNGTLPSCASAGPVLTAVTPVGVGITSVTSGNTISPYLYFTDTSASKVYYCNISTSSETYGDISGCTQTATSYAFNSPRQINFYGNYAYIANNSGNNIIKCSVSSDGQLTSCDEAANLGNSATPVGIAFKSGHLYVTDSKPNNNAIYSCQVVENGALNNCSSNSEGLSLNQPVAISISSDELVSAT